MKALLLTLALQGGFELEVHSDSEQLKSQFTSLQKENLIVYVNPKSRDFIRYLKARGFESIEK